MLLKLSVSLVCKSIVNKQPRFEAFLFRSNPWRGGFSVKLVTSMFVVRDYSDSSYQIFIYIPEWESEKIKPVESSFESSLR